MLSDEQIKRLLRILAEHDCQDAVYWNHELNFYVICNDQFFWATADNESIESDADIDAFDQACKDADIIWGPLLYCARRRKLRPQGCIYKEIDKEFYPLFDVCGPDREVDIWNTHRPKEEDGK